MSIKPYWMSWGEMQEFCRDQSNTVLKLTEKLGQVAFVNMLGINLYLISDPAIIRELLIQHPGQLHRDPTTRRVLGRIVGDSLFISEGAAWQR